MHAVLSGQRKVLPGWDDLSLNREQRVRQWLEVSLNRVRGEFLGRGVQGDEAELRRGGEAWIAGRLEEQVWLPQVDLLSEAAGAQRLPAQCLWLGPAPRSLAEWQTWLVRLGELPAYLAGLEERLHSKALLRTLPPKQTLLRARTASLAWIAGRPFNSLSSTPSPWQREAGAQLDASPDLEDEERENLRTQIDRVLADQVGPPTNALPPPSTNCSPRPPMRSACTRAPMARRGMPSDSRRSLGSRCCRRCCTNARSPKPTNCRSACARGCGRRARRAPWRNSCGTCARVRPGRAATKRRGANAPPDGSAWPMLGSRWKA
ncbi:MAG: hypothetical protein R3F17_02925 [Planctomycetota bacterium]